MNLDLRLNLTVELRYWTEIYAANGQLTDGGEDAGEAEVVNSIEREQVEEELLLFLLISQEGVTLVQLPAAQKKPSHQLLGLYCLCDYGNNVIESVW